MSLKKKITGLAKGIVTGIAVDHLMNQKDPVFDLKLERKSHAVRLDSNTLIPISEFSKFTTLVIDQSTFFQTTNSSISVKITFNPDSISMGKYTVTPETVGLLLIDLLAFVKSLNDPKLTESITDIIPNFYSLYTLHLQTQKAI